MLVYRVENREGNGPYSFIDFSHGNTDTHPTPGNDGIAFVGFEAFCGFSTMEKFRNWFSYDDRVRLKEAGFHLATYEVSREHDRNPNTAATRMCVAGYMLPDENYKPPMDRDDRGTTVSCLVDNYPKDVPSWWRTHVGLLSDLQSVHDKFYDTWNAEQLVGLLSIVASDHNLDSSAIAKIR